MDKRFGLACVNYRYVAYPTWASSVIHHFKDIIPKNCIVFDAYAGSGSIAIQFSKLRRIKRVIATERDFDSFQCLLKNIRKYQKIKAYNMSSLELDVASDILILDPPWLNYIDLPVAEIYRWLPYINKYKPLIIIINAPVNNPEIPVFYNYRVLQDFCYARCRKICSIFIYIRKKN